MASPAPSIVIISVLPHQIGARRLNTRSGSPASGSGRRFIAPPARSGKVIGQGCFQPAGARVSPKGDARKKGGSQVAPSFIWLVRSRWWQSLLLPQLDAPVHAARSDVTSAVPGFPKRVA